MCSPRCAQAVRGRDDAVHRRAVRCQGAPRCQQAAMRIRDFKWSTDVILPAGSLLIAAGAALSGVTRVALLMGGVFIVQALRVVARLQSRRHDGSSATIVAGVWGGAGVLY